MALLPKVKLKSVVNFPANVLDGTGVDVVKQNGTYQFNIAFDDFAPPVAGLTDAAHQTALLWNTATQTYTLAPISLFGGSGGIPEAPNDGVQYGRQSSGWTAILTSSGGFTADKRIFLSTAGNDANNGLSPGSAKLTLQAAINAANPNGTVYAGSGTFTLAAALNMQPGVKLIGTPGTIITQGNSANLSRLIDFTPNAANGASIEGCTINGNRANNTDNDGVNGVYIGTANDVSLEHNKFLNMNGSAVNVSDGLRPIIRFNDFQNFMTMGIASSASSTAIRTTGQYNFNTFSNNLGQHVIYVVKSNSNQIVGNTITATQIIGNATATAPHTITWISGTNFAGLQAGGFVVMSPGGVATEYHITSVNSNTQLTVFETVTAQVNASFIVGTGDIISIGNSAANQVKHNLVIGGSSGGVVLHNFNGGQTLQENTVDSNEFYYIGGAAISIQGTTTAPVTTASDTTINNNRIVSAGMGGAAVGATGKCGIGLLDFAPTTIGSVIISGNRIQNEGGLSTMDWGIYLSGVSNGQVYAGINTEIGLTNVGIRNGVSIALGAGWGTTAAVANIVAHGSSLQFRVTPGGTGIAANPTITVSTPATSLTQPPQFQFKGQDNNAAVLPVVGDLGGVVTATSFIMTYVGTPTSALVCNFGVVGS